MTHKKQHQRFTLLFSPLVSCSRLLDQGSGMEMMIAIVSEIKKQQRESTADKQTLVVGREQQRCISPGQQDNGSMDHTEVEGIPPPSGQPRGRERDTWSCTSSVIAAVKVCQARREDDRWRQLRGRRPAAAPPHAEEEQERTALIENSYQPDIQIHELYWEHRRRRGIVTGSNCHFG